MVNLQDSFLNHLRRIGTDATIVMANGDRLKGAVLGFDNFTIVLRVGGVARLVYKHAVAHVGDLPAALAQGIVPSARRPGAEERPARPAEPRPAAFNPLDVSQVDLGDAAN